MRNELDPVVTIVLDLPHGEEPLELLLPEVSSEANPWSRGQGRNQTTHAGG
jgi:hypothetical protein